MRQAFSFSTDCPYTPRKRRNKWFIPTEFRLFRGTGNSRNTVEQKRKQTFGILFRSILRKRKQLGIPLRGTKIKGNFRNFVPKHFVEENKLSILFAETFALNHFLQTRHPKISKIVSEKRTFEVPINHFVKLVFSLNSVPFRAAELTLPEPRSASESALSSAE